MADRILRIRVLDDSGEMGVEVGRIVRRANGVIFARGEVAEDLLARAGMAQQLTVDEAFSALERDGWTNTRLTLDTSG